MAGNTQCPLYGLGSSSDLMVAAARRGHWEISRTTAADEPRLLSLLGGQEAAPKLAKVLQDYYGTQQVDNPKEAEERRRAEMKKAQEQAQHERDRTEAERRKMRQADRDKAVELIASALTSDAPARARAATLLEGLSSIFAPAN